MANHCEWNDEKQTIFDGWLRGRPQVIVDLARRCPPQKLYRMKSSGHRCYPLSYSEDGTLTVSVDGTFNLVVFSRQVFGVSPDDLEECELPAPDEQLGDMAEMAGYDEKDIREILIPEMKRRRVAELPESA